jgi:hypothetical protein
MQMHILHNESSIQSLETHLEKAAHRLRAATALQSSFHIFT